MTFSRSQRRSAPIFSVCRPFSQVSVSAICVTLVLKSVAVFGGDPSCWYPAIRNVGSVFGNRAVDGMPAGSSPLDAALLSSAAVRPTVRRVSPMRSSFSRRSENVRW